MSCSNFHSIVLIWTFLSMPINLVTSTCYFQGDQLIYYTDWVCSDITLSSRNPDVGFQSLEKTNLSIFGFQDVTGEFDSDTLKNFTSLTKFFINNAKFSKFDFKYDNIKSILVVRVDVPEGSHFANCCANLEKISLKNFNGLDLENGCFEGLSKLRTLHIANGTMKHVTYNSFKGLYRLKELTLINNSIETIEEDAFIDLINLRELYIEENKLKSIHPRVFESLQKLRSLTIYGQSLEPLRLEMFKNQRGLTDIGLPFKTWKDVKVEKIPQMFPQLSFFSHKRGMENKDESEYVMRKHKKLTLLLFRDRDN